MSQHDYNIANQGFPATRADLNNALAALASTSSGVAAPTTTYANQFWYDTTNNLLMFRNADNDAWITFAYLDQATDEWEIRTAVIQAVDAAGLTFKTDDGIARVTIDDAGLVSVSGNFLVGKTAEDVTVEGVEIRSTGKLNIRADGPALDVRMSTTSASDYIAVFRDDNTGVIKIGESGNAGFIEGITGDTGLKFEGAHLRPRDNQVDADNAVDLGSGVYRFDDVYATNGTINTSDRNEKQDIEELTDAEQRVAVVAKGLMRKFRWRDAVTEKGDEARTHFGIIAQDLQAAFAAEGLDAGRYAMFISNTWWETIETFTDEETGEERTRTITYDTQEEAPEGATERTRLGVRYSELLAFIIAAI